MRQMSKRTKTPEPKKQYNYIYTVCKERKKSRLDPTHLSFDRANRGKPCSLVLLATSTYSLDWAFISVCRSMYLVTLHEGMFQACSHGVRSEVRSQAPGTGVPSMLYFLGSAPKPPICAYLGSGPADSVAEGHVHRKVDSCGTSGACCFSFSLVSLVHEVSRWSGIRSWESFPSDPPRCLPCMQYLGGGRKRMDSFHNWVIFQNVTLLRPC